MTGTSSLSVMIVENDADQADMLAEFVHVLGHRVVSIGTAEEALAIARHDTPDVILVDIGLPGPDGHWLVEQLRVSGIRSHIIATTGYDGALVRETARRAGVDVYLLKPFSLMTIREQLTQVLSAKLAALS